MSNRGFFLATRAIVGLLLLAGTGGAATILSGPLTAGGFTFSNIGCSEIEDLPFACGPAELPYDVTVTAGVATSGQYAGYSYLTFTGNATSLLHNIDLELTYKVSYSGTPEPYEYNYYLVGNLFGLFPGQNGIDQLQSYTDCDCYLSNNTIVDYATPFTLAQFNSFAMIDYFGDPITAQTTGGSLTAYFEAVTPAPEPGFLVSPGLLLVGYALFRRRFRRG